jgi:pimeloyl-ACP methyl ester carboxylesterase
MQRRERLLGAFVGAAGLPVDALPLDGVDFLVVSASDALGGSGAADRPFLVLVDSADQVHTARSAGAFGVVAVDGAEGPPVPGVDAVLADHGAARWAASPAAARAAFAAGAQLVVYDLPAMVDHLVATLAEGRPPATAPAAPAAPADLTGVSARTPFVLLSGMLGDSSLWDGLSSRLADVVLPWPVRIDLDDSVPEMAASVLAEAPSRFALGAHSLGAVVALEIVRQAPERVTRLVLFNASGRGPSEAQQDAWAAWRRRTEDGEFEQVAAELASATLPPSRRGDTALVETNGRMAHTVGPDGFIRQLSAQATRPDSLASVGAITVPVLVVSGELDEICPPALQEELVAHCPGARLVSVAGAGHMAPLEAPDELADELRRWFAAD